MEHKGKKVSENVFSTVPKLRNVDVIQLTFISSPLPVRQYHQVIPSFYLLHRP